MFPVRRPGHLNTTAARDSAVKVRIWLIDRALQHNPALCQPARWKDDQRRDNVACDASGARKVQPVVHDSNPSWSPATSCDRSSFSAEWSLYQPPATAQKNSHGMPGPRRGTVGICPSGGSN